MNEKAKCVNRENHDKNISFQSTKSKQIQVWNQWDNAKTDCCIYTMCVAEYVSLKVVILILR